MAVFGEFLSSNGCRHRCHICFFHTLFFSLSFSLLFFTFDFRLPKYATDGQYFAIIAYVMAFNRENYVNTNSSTSSSGRSQTPLSTSLSVRVFIGSPFACTPFCLSPTHTPNEVVCMRNVYLEKLTVINCDDVKSNVSIVCSTPMIDTISRFIDLNEYIIYKCTHERTYVRTCGIPFPFAFACIEWRPSEPIGHLNI